MLKLILCDGSIIWVNPSFVTRIQLETDEEGIFTQVNLAWGGQVLMEGDRVNYLAHAVAALLNRNTYTVDAGDVSIPS